MLSIAKTKEEAFVIDNKQYSNYIQDREAEYLYKSDIREAREEGLAEGLEQGLERGRQQEKHAMVQSLLDQGIDDSVISTASGLSIDEIEALRKNDNVHVVIGYKAQRSVTK